MHMHTHAHAANAHAKAVDDVVMNPPGDESGPACVASLGRKLLWVIKRGLLKRIENKMSQNMNRTSPELHRQLQARTMRAANLNVEHITCSTSPVDLQARPPHGRLRRGASLDAAQIEALERQQRAAVERSGEGGAAGTALGCSGSAYSIPQMFAAITK